MSSVAQSVVHASPLAAYRARLRRLYVESEAVRLFAWLAAADAAVVVLHLTNRLSGVEKRLFDLGLEQNVPTWLGTVQFLGVALCAAFLARESAGRLKLAFVVVAASFAFFSLDELALIKDELVQNIAHSQFDDVWYWPALYAPIGGIAVVALLAVAGEVRRRLGSVLPLAAGLALLVAAPLLDGAAEASTSQLVFEVEVVVEEWFELTGTAILTATFLAVLLRRRAARA